jgi:drug/metabolite transporter (DMT)-like permease
MKNTATFKDYLKLHLVILIWGITGILGKLISISAVSIVWYRTLIAFISILIFLIIKNKEIKIPINSLFKYLGTGIIVASHWFFFFEALKVSTVSVTLATLASATLFTSLLEPLFFKKKIVGYEILFGLMVIVGLFLIFSFETKYQLGILYSLISAFCASLFTTLNGIFVAKGGRPMQITMYEMLGAVGILTFYLIFTQNLNMNGLNLIDPITHHYYLNLVYLLILGIICTSIAFVISVDVMKKLTPFTVSISINMEPIYAIIMALLIFGKDEKMTWGFYLGTFLIISTIFGNGILKKRKSNN